MTSMKETSKPTRENLSIKIVILHLREIIKETLYNLKVDFQSVLRRLNGLFWFFVLKTTYVMYDLYEMYQFVPSYIN